MSEVIERESALSVLFSSIGAWLALGAGMGLLVLALLGCLNQVYGQEQAVDAHRLLRSRLQHDLVSLGPGAVRINDQGDRIELDCIKDAQTVTVVYSLDANHIFRQTGLATSREVVGSGSRLHFSLHEGLLTVSVDQVNTFFAVRRWSNQ